MGAVQKKTLSIVLALSLALSMLGATGLQLLSAGTAHAAEVLGTNLVYENVYGLMKPSDSQYAYAIMWNDDVESTWDEKTDDSIPAKGTYKVVRSDGKVTMSFAENNVRYGFTSASFYECDGLLHLTDGVFTLDGKRIAKSEQSCTYKGCALYNWYSRFCYDATSKLVVYWNGDKVTVCKKDGSLVQTIPMPELPGNPQSGNVGLSYVKDSSGSAICMSLSLQYKDITREEMDSLAVPNDGWAVERSRGFDGNPRDWRASVNDTIRDEGTGNDAPNPDFATAKGSGSIELEYGLRFNASKGVYETFKLGTWDYANVGATQEEWVPGSNSDYSAFRQLAMTNGVRPYVLKNHKDTCVTTAKDAQGTSLFIAGYAIGAQSMRDNSVASFGTMHVYPQNQATGLYFAYKNGKYGVIDEKGNVKVPFEYDKFCNNTFSRTSIVLMKKGSAWSFIDLAKEQTQTAVAKNDVSKAKVTVGSKTYTGKKLKPSTIKVVLNGKTLKKGTDYTASCSGGKKIGAYKVTIKGKGKYIGTVASTFTIVPKEVAISKATALKKGFTVSWKKPSKTYLKQTTGYQVRYAKDKAFKKSLSVKNVKKNSAISVKVRGLSAGKTYYVQVRAYKTVGKVKYYSAWSKTVKVKTKKR